MVMRMVISFVSVVDERPWRIEDGPFSVVYRPWSQYQISRATRSRTQRRQKRSHWPKDPAPHGRPPPERMHSRRDPGGPHTESGRTAPGASSHCPRCPGSSQRKRLKCPALQWLWRSVPRTAGRWVNTVSGTPRPHDPPPGAGLVPARFRLPTDASRANSP
jgi:hypothetical protein